MLKGNINIGTTANAQIILNVIPRDINTVSLDFTWSFTASSLHLKTMNKNRSSMFLFNKNLLFVSLIKVGLLWFTIGKYAKDTQLFNKLMCKAGKNDTNANYSAGKNMKERIWKEHEFFWDV